MLTASIRSSRGPARPARRDGASDAVVLADAHFPADRLAERLLPVPGIATPDLLAAVRTVVPLDDARRRRPDGDARRTRLPVQDELVAAAGAPARSRFLDRQEFYDVAASAFLVVRTGETRAVRERDPAQGRWCGRERAVAAGGRSGVEQELPGRAGARGRAPRPAPRRGARARRARTAPASRR